MAGLRAVLGICVLFSGVCVSSGSTINIPQTQYKVARGDDALLPCQLSPPPSATSTLNGLFWTASPDNPADSAISVATFHSPASVKIATKYKGRANLTYDVSKGQFNLQLLRVTSADTRKYECKADIEQEDDSPTDSANLIVLVAPSTPICNVNGKTEYFQDLTLNCRSEEGTPTPTYKWQIYDVTNQPRPLPLKATDQNGVLSLYNISKDTSGYYVCTSTNEIRSAKCNLTLSVMPPSMNMASAGGIIGAAVAALVLLIIIIIICCCCRKKNKQEEEYTMGSPEGGEYTDVDPDGKEERVKYEEERPVKSAERAQDERSEPSYDRRSDYDERKDRTDDRRDRYDRDDRYDDRRDRDDRYDDRRDRDDRYDDRRDRYDDRRDRNDDRRDRYDDRRDRNDDRRDRYDDHYDSDRYDSRDRPPSIPPNKPKDPRN